MTDVTPGLTLLIMCAGWAIPCLIIAAIAVYDWFAVFLAAMAITEILKNITNKKKENK